MIISPFTTPTPSPAFDNDFALRFLIAFASLICLTLFIYWPGLTGPFILDDYANLHTLGDNGGVNSLQNFLTFVFGNTSGPSGRPVSMLSFLIDGQQWPAHIASFKYTNILIHILNGIMLCWLSLTLFRILGLTLTRSAICALVVTALWLLHPFNSTTTLYIVQRMTQLMTLFGLASLLCYLKGRELILSEPRRGSIMLCLALFPFGLLSVLSKENGALLLPLIVLFEFSVFRLVTRNKLFTIWYRVGVVAPLLLIGLYLLITLPSSIAGFELRHYSMGERLLTEARILLIYISKIFLPNTIGAGLFHDDIQISHSFIEPISTLFSILGLGTLLSIGIIVRKKETMLFFGIAWFFIMHLLESGHLPLELYFEHRNYMAMIGPLISLVWYLNIFMQNASSKQSKKLLVTIIGGVSLFMAFLTWQQSHLWGNSGQLVAFWAFEKPGSSRAQIEYARFLAANGAPDAALERLEMAHALQPKEIALLLHMWNHSCEFSLEPPYSLQQISEMQGLEFFHNDINFHLVTFLENLATQKCVYPRKEVAISVFESIDAMPLSDARRMGFYILFSDLYVLYGQLDGALIQRTKAFELGPVPAIPYRQAVMSASAGNYEDALIFLERARRANQETSLLRPSMVGDIDRMEGVLRQALGVQQ